MDRKEAIDWVLSMTGSLRRSQAKTLAELVGGVLLVARVSLASIGRAVRGTTTAKHRIKRVWRFCSNHRVEVSTAMEEVVARLAGRRRRKLVVNMDWTDVRGFKTLMAAADLRGRSVPLLWASYGKWEFYKSQNNLEEGLLRRLRTMLPEGTRVIVLADRGFGRTEYARTCQQLGFHYVIRIEPKVWVANAVYEGKLADYPVRRGTAVVLKDVRYRQHGPVEQHVAIRWKRGLPKRRDECWYLMTDLNRSATALSDLYAQRMTVEELFRDGKNRRNGWALRHTQLTKPDRVDRLLLILALAYLLLCGIGLLVREHYNPSTWCSNTKENTCSVFTIGLFVFQYLPDIAPSAEQALKQVNKAINQAAPNWG